MQEKLRPKAQFLAMRLAQARLLASLRYYIKKSFPTYYQANEPIGSHGANTIGSESNAANCSGVKNSLRTTI